uniref:RING-type E3 ubiquitin transferase n=1 Tax=Sinocyclocheilus anshuiensis TaxID=1608454 RepID=A0A671Q8X5_9TELE
MRRCVPEDNMDESSLLDLLECSVCLERLDTSAKVLPCQHTFCRRCLENIVSSRHELRCPECRVLVDCVVDDLPANILLVRLLDGIKQRPRNGGGRAALAGCAAGGSASPGSGHSHSQLPRQLTHTGPNVPQLPCGKALYSYEGKEAGDLKFSKGDIIILRRKVDENWFHGELNGSHGFLPASYIQCIRPLSQTPPQGKALYDFEVKDKDQDKDCLTFTKDEILTVIRRVDDNWAEGMLGDKIGFFPILYVELNETAKQLMEMDKPSASAEAVSCNGNGAHTHAEGKKNAKKRHSFTALSMTQRSAQVMENNRHSMEISAPMLISSSDPRAAARIADCPHLSSSAPATQVQTHEPVLQCHTGTTHTPVLHAPATQVQTHTCPPVPLAPATQEHGSLVNLSLGFCRYLAMYAYKPQKADELELRKGEMYRVMEKCQDGWFKGTSLRSGASGVFPGNYVTPISRALFLCVFSQKEKRSSGLLKLLSGAAAKKKSRSPPSVSPTHEPSAHGRAGSCPIESEMQGAMGMEPLHRKTGSLELNFSVSPPARQPCSSSPLAARPDFRSLSVRYRVVVPYPPQSEAEIELKEGDVVFVHKKREDGWFKGTLQRTGRTGLFPSSFMESF